MAALTSFAITILLDQSRTNPINSLTFQAVSPWGKSAAKVNVRDALYDLCDKCGSMQAGVMGAYMNSQTLNGATGTGPTGFTNANEIGIP